MGRNNTLKYELHKSLGEQIAYGQSKYDDKQKTRMEREKIRADMQREGFNKDDIDKALRDIDYTKDKIYSKSTFDTYERQVGYFADFVRDRTGSSRTSLEESKSYIQDYISYGVTERNLSPYTLNLQLAAICKSLGSNVNMRDYEHPERSYEDCFRGQRGAINDEYNAERAKEALEVNRIIGLRRSELERLRLDDIKETDRGLEVHTRGKGGRHNINLVFEKERIDRLNEYIDRAMAAGRDTLMSKEDMNNDANLHKLGREARAKEVYYHVKDDIEKNPDRREYYKQEIERQFRERGRKFTDEMRDKLDKSYITRGDVPMSFDRTAAMFTSVYVTNHTRENVTIMHYLCK